MPLQNRVDPYGRLVASFERGLLMGNRGGQFHSSKDKSLHPVRRWASRQWIICLTEFNNRHRDVWTKGYTELFFMDEIVALSAGHRPCFECRRHAANEFARRAVPGKDRPFAGEIDKQLHFERLEKRRKKTFSAKAGSLPDGAMFEFNGAVLTRKENNFLSWHPKGYSVLTSGIGSKVHVNVLTPRLTVNALERGYEPIWHPCA